MIPTLARSAVAAGCNGVFMEVHYNVEIAKSDASTQWPLDQLKDLLISIKAIGSIPARGSSKSKYFGSVARVLAISNLLLSKL